MKDLLTPDYMFGQYSEITPAFLSSIGVRALLIDIDNTLAPYEQPEPDDRIREWFAGLAENGIKAALVSNNHAPRVELFNREIGAFAVCESKKPFARAVKAACSHFGVKPNETAVIGDQIFTDVWCARNAGSLAILVKPIPYPENLFFKCK